MTQLETTLIIFNVVLFFAWMIERKRRKALQNHPLVLFGDMLKVSFTDAIKNYKHDPIKALKDQLKIAEQEENYEEAKAIKEQIEKLENDRP